VPVSHSKTAMQQWKALIDARVYAILALERPREPSAAAGQPLSVFSYDERTAVIQEPQEAVSVQGGNAVMRHEETPDGNTVMHSTLAPAEPQKRLNAQDGHAAIRPQEPSGAPSYDTGKYYLGKLCPRHHAYEEGPQSLRYRGSKRCIQCDTEDVQARRAARKQH